MLGDALTHHLVVDLLHLQGVYTRSAVIQGGDRQFGLYWRRGASKGRSSDWSVKVMKAGIPKA